MEYKKILITGIRGSGASYLAEHLIDAYPDLDIHGTHRGSSNRVVYYNNDKVIAHESDLNDFSSTLKTLDSVRPDAVIHLASNANVGASFRTPIPVLQNNIIGTANLLESIKLMGLKCRFLLCGSSEVYGNPKKEDCPVDELSLIHI